MAFPVRKLRTPMRSRRRPGEPIAGLPRGDETGGAGPPLAVPPAATGRPTPTGVGGRRYAGRGTRFRGQRAYADEHGTERRAQVRGYVRDRHHDAGDPTA